MTYHILVTDQLDAEALDLLNKTEDISVQAPGNMSREETLAAIAKADGLIIRSGTTADAELLNAAPQLKAIARAGVGVDNVDLNMATRCGIVVMNTPDGNTISTAEHTFGLMLALARQIPAGHLSMREGKWDRKSFMGVELRNKTLGIVGFGRIGRALAMRALAFEMKVLAVDPYIAPDVVRDMGAALVSLDTLFARSDFITLHALATDETRNMVCAENIAKMKRGVRIINAARGVLVNETDLADAIKSGHVAGAALDVYAKEPPPADHPLIGLPNVIHTPHLAASTTDAQVRVGVDAAQQVIDALIRHEYHNVVNLDVLKNSALGD